MPGRIPLRLSIATALALGTLGCSASGGNPIFPSSGSPAPTQTQASPVSPERTASASRAPVAEVLRFTAPRLGGGRIDGEDYSGRDTAFWFWAPW
jgi:hypothetical protein